MNREAFVNLFGTEEQCLNYLIELRWNGAFVCPNADCNSREAWKMNKRTHKHKYKCKKCGHQTSITSGTIFQDSHSPLTIWFKGIWYIMSNRITATVAGLQKELQLNNYKTAKHIFNSIQKTKIHPVYKRLSGEVFLVKKHFIPINGKGMFVFIAAEIEGKKVGRILLKLYNDKFDIEAFRQKYIDMNNSNIHISADVPKAVTERIIAVQSRLNAYINRFNPKTEMQKIIDICCKIENHNFEFYPFEELVKNAVNISNRQ
jgi:predicted RNA-binding Zn-ribbon protein involved in translation (DUF1610 family)